MISLPSSRATQATPHPTRRVSAQVHFQTPHGGKPRRHRPAIAEEEFAVCASDTISDVKRLARLRVEQMLGSDNIALYERSQMTESLVAHRGALSAKDACIACWWAHKAGVAGRIGHLGMRPGRLTGYYNRHFDKVVDAGRGSADDDLYPAVALAGTAAHPHRKLLWHHRHGGGSAGDGPETRVVDC